MKSLYVVGSIFALGPIIACNPYEDGGLRGEFNAGSADPVNYPPPYRGAGAMRNIAGSGNGFTEVNAFIGGSDAGYFLFPYAPSQIVTPGYVYTAAQLYSDAGVSDAGYAITQTRNALQAANLSLPLAYVFDPPGGDSPFPAPQQCIAPAGYSYDPRRDDVHYDEQGSIFITLPNATFTPGSLPTWSYVPIVREVPVASNGERCQDIKSAATLLSRGDVNVPRVNPNSTSGRPDGRYLAWAHIDPGSAVYRVGQSAPRTPTLDQTGASIQRWGWYEKFLVAYINGGYIPSSGGTLRAQNLYIPAQVLTGTPATPSPGKVGAGYDVLDYPRGDPNYSPICQVLVYTTTPVRPPSGLPKSRDEVNALPGGANPPAPPSPNSVVSGDVIPPFVFCLQSP